MAIESDDLRPPSQRSAFFGTLAHRPPGERGALPDEGRVGSFDRATGWIGTTPLTNASVRGHVLLVDFWTYTCINWLRTLPYLRAWHAAYAEAGLVIVGVHTPEFPFEHDVGNVSAAVARLGIEYPVAIDNDYGVWDDFANHYWPALYVADAAGRLRHHHFGEGDYDRTGVVLQELLADTGAAVDRQPIVVEPEGLEVAADWRSLRSPETYLGRGPGSAYIRTDDSRPQRDAVARAGTLPVNHWTLTGVWTRTPSAAILESAGGRISFAFHARDVNLVMGPALPGAEIKFRVLLDGSEPGSAGGTDVDSHGGGTVREQNTYQLIRQPGAVVDRVVTIEYTEPGVEAFCFTFG